MPDWQEILIKHDIKSAMYSCIKITKDDVLWGTAKFMDAPPGRSVGQAG